MLLNGMIALRLAMEYLYRKDLEGPLAGLGPSEYEKDDGELAKLQQTTSARDYQCRFERLSNQARDCTN